LDHFDCGEGDEDGIEEEDGGLETNSKAKRLNIGLGKEGMI
jgi:hypothetical protein